MKSLQFLCLVSTWACIVYCESDGVRQSVCKCSGLAPCSGHGLTGGPLDRKEYQVQLQLLKDGKPVDCMQKRTDYYVVINSTQLIKGFIITSTQPGESVPRGKYDKSVGQFEMDDQFDPIDGKYFYGACKNTVSHSQVLLQNTVSIPWSSKSYNKPVQFLFSVVFERYKWLSDLRAVFPVCQSTPVDVESSGDSGPSGHGPDYDNKTMTCVLVETPIDPIYYMPSVIDVGDGHTVNITYTCSEPTLTVVNVCNCTCDTKCITEKIVRVPYKCKSSQKSYRKGKEIIYIKDITRRKRILTHTSCSCCS